MKKLRVLDLFSGIGGFSLGLERCVVDGAPAFKTVAFCEIEKYPQKVLAKHWPGVPIYDDVRTLTAERLAGDGIGGIDVITGGFPCQDLSVAGNQAGMGEGTRSGLWSEIARLIGELRPQYAIVENVAALLSGDRGRWFGRVLGDLAECGYDAEWENIPAAAVGAPHRRERVWVVAYPAKNGNKKQQIPYFREDKTGKEGAGVTDKLHSILGTAPAYVQRFPIEPRIHRMVDGISSSMDRLAACGNAVVPQIPELIGRAILAHREAA